MRGSKIPIYTYGLGHVMSAAVDILMCGEAGHRHVFPHTSVMTHQWSAGLEGKDHELQSYMKYSEIMNAKSIELIKERTGLTEKVIKSKLLGPSDVYLTPEEAVKYKLVDRIVDSIFP